MKQPITNMTNQPLASIMFQIDSLREQNTGSEAGPISGITTL